MNIPIYGLSNPEKMMNKVITHICINKPNYLYPINKIHSISVSSIRNKYNFYEVKFLIEYSSVNSVCYCFLAYLEIESEKIKGFYEIHITDIAVNYITDKSIYITLTFGVTI